MTSIWKYMKEIRMGCLIIILFFVGASAASAETLMMPNRPMLMGTSEVVWGITTYSNGTAYSMDFGDGSPVLNGTVVDRSYIAFNHTYMAAGLLTAKLTVGAESASAAISVYNPSTTSAFDLRNVNIKRAIENGLRYLWYAQSNRTDFDLTPTTHWGNYPGSFTALVVLSFENQQYLLPTDDSVPTDLYPKYIVQRGLNYIASAMTYIDLTLQTTDAPVDNNDPCQTLGTTAPCTGLTNNVDGDQGYSTSLILLPFAGSGALNRHMGAFGPAQASGQKYGDIVKALTATIAWGQIDQNGSYGRGGWHYSLANNANDTSDASTMGWNVLALLDSGASGTTIPAFVSSELNTYALPNHFNTDDSFDYNTDGNPASDYIPNLAKDGIALEALFFTGRLSGDTLVQAALNYINTHWTDFSGLSYGCANGTYNLGCSYGMFNLFKGLKLYGISTMANSTRPAGPGTIPAHDWYAEYVDWLVANQTSPTSTIGGNWNAMSFSCCTDDASANVGIAELILAPVTLIQPDPTKFSTIGLAPATASNAPGTSHMVTATTLSVSGAPVPGVTISFLVLDGPNVGKTGTATTDANGHATFTYTDTSTGPYPKTDHIRAFIGQVNSNQPSNIVSKVWGLVCDVNGDGVVNILDINLITKATGQRVQAGDPRDYDNNGIINVNDARGCVLKCTKANCAQ